MSQATTTGVQRSTETGKWIGAIGAGLVGGIVMGVVMAVLTPTALTTAIPALYGQSGAIVGWIAHLSHAAVLGLIFAGIVRFGGLTRYVERPTTSLGLGVAYGILLWVVTGSIILPAWLGAVGVAGAPPVPTFDLTSLLTHLVYGSVLGVVYPYVRTK